MKRNQCNPEERRCSRKRRRVCFQPEFIHSDEERRKPRHHQGGKIDLTAKTPVAVNPMPAQISAFDPYTIDLTSPSLVNIIARPSTPFMIDLTH